MTDLMSAGACAEEQMDYERRWAHRMAEWLGRFVKKPTKDDDLYLGDNGSFGRCAPSVRIYRKDYKHRKMTLSDMLAETRKENAERIAQEESLFPPGGRDWDPFSQIDPWCYSDGLLSKIKHARLMSLFLRKLEFGGADGTRKFLDQLMSRGPHGLAEKMAEALVEILEEKGIKP